MATNTSDCIEKQILLKAPRARVWRALTDSREFGEWFGMRLDAPFVAGTQVSGRIVFRGEELEAKLDIVCIQPETHFAYLWHPYAIEPDVDYTGEPPTLVSFELSDQPGGTLLRIVESGFDRIPVARRATAFRMNNEGWGIQAQNIEAHLAKTR